MHSVRQLAEEQRYAAAIALLDSAAVQDSDGSAGALQQQRLICSILMHVQQREWWQVGGHSLQTFVSTQCFQVHLLTGNCTMYHCNVGAGPAPLIKREGSPHPGQETRQKGAPGQVFSVRRRGRIQGCLPGSSSGDGRSWGCEPSPFCA